MLFFKKRERNRVENRPSIYPECLNDFFPFLYMSCMDFLLLVLLDLACPPVGPLRDSRVSPLRTLTHFLSSFPSQYGLLAPTRPITDYNAHPAMTVVTSTAATEMMVEYIESSGPSVAALDTRSPPVLVAEIVADTDPIVALGTTPELSSFMLSAYVDKAANPTEAGLYRNTEYTFF